eukprot:scaffold36612_cov56-Phaeocystis_antarctica.AAC.1
MVVRHLHLLRFYYVLYWTWFAYFGPGEGSCKYRRLQVATVTNVYTTLVGHVTHSVLRGSPGRDAPQDKLLERRQCTAGKRRDEGGAADVGDLSVFEIELLELRQPSLWRPGAAWCLRRNGGEALVAERVVHETERYQRGQPPQGRREGH